LRVYVDSPLAVDATGIYRLHPEAYDEETAEVLNDHPGSDPFGFDMLRYVRTTQESKELNFLKEPAIIISASGMAEAGRVLHHLKNNIEDPRNTIVIVGWQAPDTLGRRLVEKQKRVHILGGEYDRRAEVEVINGLSAHADRSELLEWAGHIQERPRHAFLVHGEPEPATSLAEAMRSQLGFPDVQIPELGQKVEL
jgi:metallo-beta-lactamase family protein